MTENPLELAYTPELVESQLRAAGLWRALWRIAQIISVIVAGFFWRTVDRWSWTYRRGETREQRQRVRAEWLLSRLIWLGPAFVKVGQALGSRPDLVPLTYVQVLSALYDRLPAFPSNIAFACFEEELGWKPETLFERYDPLPFAAASLGQVYHAVTHQGEEVAVKIQRPDLIQVISLDIALLRRLASVVQRFRRLGRGQPWVDIVDEFSNKLFEELDYVHEAHLTERFRTNVAGVQGVSAPRVYWDYTSRRVLTTEFIRGIKVTDREELLAAGLDVSFLLRQGVRANLQQLFEHGLFHADPHPGNLLVRPEDATLVFIDFGMMGIVTPERRMRIIEIFVDVINQRPENLKENLEALGFLRPDARWDEVVPLATAMFNTVFGSQEQRYRFQDVANSFAPLLYEYEFRIPIDFALIVRAIMMLEGISLQLDAGFDIFAVSAPFAARMMLTLPNPGLRQRLMAEMLTEDGSLNWFRLDQLAGLVVRDTDYTLETEGLAEPALDLLLSPEGSALRRALIADLLKGPDHFAEHAQPLAALLSADPSLSGKRILDRLVAFLFSPDGEDTKKQLAAGLSSADGSLDPRRVVTLANLARQLHPDFRVGTLFLALGGYLFSEQGRPARNELLVEGTGRIVGALAGQLNRLARGGARTAQRDSASKGKEKAGLADAQVGALTP